MRAGAVLLSLLAPAASLPADVPAKTQAELPLAGVTEVTVGLVEIAPEVFDEYGARVGDLGRRDFRIYDRGERVRVVRFRVEELPVAIHVVADTSASMRAAQPQLRQAVRDVLDRCGKQDRFTLYTINHRLRRFSEATVGEDVLRAVASGIEVRGGTRINDALITVLREAGQLPGRRAVLLLTDSRGGSSDFDNAAVREAAREAGVPVYVAAVEVADGRRLRPRDFAALARSTGGRATRFSESDAFVSFLEHTLRDLRARYILDFAPAPGPDGFRPLRVEVRGPGLRVDHREGYNHGTIRP